MIKRRLLQYISDIHVDYKLGLPIIKQTAENLAICGDIGNPDHPSYEEFIYHIRPKYNNIYFVPGNHDFNCSAKYNHENVLKYEPILKKICNTHDIHYLNKNKVDFEDNKIIAGCTLWSYPIVNRKKINIIKHRQLIDHTKIHIEHINWLNNCIDYAKNKDKELIILTHYVPTVQLIEDKYLKRGRERTSWFYSNLDNMIKYPVTNWYCGHTHSKIEKTINGTVCGVNAIINYNI
jgi:hypothetical protein